MTHQGRPTTRPPEDTSVAGIARLYRVRIETVDGTASPGGFTFARLREIDASCPLL